MTAHIIRGDARALPLPDASVDLVVTSPPYFGLRSYIDNGEHYEGQIGSEATPAEYMAELLDCTREWVRVLKPSGSIFVNLGDKYAGVGGSNGHGWCIDSESTRERRASVRVPLGKGRTSMAPAKSLMGLPWRYALGCIDELGLILRAEIIWGKVNGLPESVTDRVRRSHEQWFHLTRQPRYYSAIDEIREPHARRDAPRALGTRNETPRHSAATDNVGWKDHAVTHHVLGKLPGSVWDIPSEPLSVPEHLGVEHFAAFPTEWCRRLILGWSPPGVCTECGEGRRPVAERASTQRHNGGRHAIEHYGAGAGPKHGLGATTLSVIPDYRITGYACACPEPTAPTTPSVVVDPFGGTGTTALVASVLGRVGISVDRSADYSRLARWRTTDPAQRAKAARVEKPPEQLDGQGDLFAGEAS